MTNVALQATNFAIEPRKNQYSDMKNYHVGPTSTTIVKTIFFIPLLSISKKIPIYISYLIWWMTQKVLGKMYINSFCTQGVINQDQNSIQSMNV